MLTLRLLVLRCLSICPVTSHLFSLSCLCICLFASVNGFNLFSSLLVIQSPQPSVCFYYT